MLPFNDSKVCSTVSSLQQLWSIMYNHLGKNTPKNSFWGTSRYDLMKQTVTYSNIINVNASACRLLLELTFILVDNVTDWLNRISRLHCKLVFAWIKFSEWLLPCCAWTTKHVEAMLQIIYEGREELFQGGEKMVFQGFNQWLEIGFWFSFTHRKFCKFH